MLSAPVIEGSKEIPMELAVMTPLLNRLSVTVGMELEVAGESVSKVKSTGPMLFKAISIYEG